MRIAIDLDGTICPIKQSGQLYEDLESLPGAVARIHELRLTGHYVIIQTARNMATCESNLGRVLKNVGKITLDWLAKHEVEYDEIYFGKPNAQVYLDDRALRFTCWQDITEQRLVQEGRER